MLDAEKFSHICASCENQDNPICSQCEKTEVPWELPNEYVMEYQKELKEEAYVGPTTPATGTKIT
jgi:hypothetical protein